MRKIITIPLAATLALSTAGITMQAYAQDNAMTFFISSANPGKGADLGGLDGADKHCQALAAAAGAGARTWRAYLSTDASSGGTAVNARDRIGKGPWRNASGVVIATSVDDLHGDAVKLDKATALDEKGAPVAGRGDKPNRHDILTGTRPDGTAFPVGDKGTTCGNWTNSGNGSAIVGHHDRKGLKDDAPSMSWNSSHASRGCGLEALRGTGGDGLIYCFAVE